MSIDDNNNWTEFTAKTQKDSLLLYFQVIHKFNCFGSQSTFWQKTLLFKFLVSQPILLFSWKEKRHNKCSPLNTVGLIIQEDACGSKMPKYILDFTTYLLQYWILPSSSRSMFSATYMEITDDFHWGKECSLLLPPTLPNNLINANKSQWEQFEEKTHLANTHHWTQQKRTELSDFIFVIIFK